MEFKPTSIESKRLGAARSGVALVEFMVALALGSLLIAAVMAVFAFSNRSFTALGNYSDLDQQSRFALDTMTREIRESDRVYEYGYGNTTWLLAQTNYLYLSNRTGWLGYYWIPSSKQVIREKWSSVTGYEYGTIMSNCDFLRFSYFQRTPNTNFGNFSNALVNPSSRCKLIQMSWICSRSVLGTVLNSESVQSAKVVIRNQ